ncbi:c-type cytochrome [Chondromyces crocatus]|uniref:Cytochrome c domain-containing protein n=1 Tax=Chondromyces crocatus TaxID=52 RepID=A0A0K1EMK6_CHOCO|nr:cytochrome c [Chondromyces crocatus]AKT42135.1 uncharacterized protein CMC5_063580 [Chondromyces crocatus]
MKRHALATSARFASLLLAGIALASCALQDAPALEGEGDVSGTPALIEIDLERMIYQQRYDPWEAASIFPDGKVMRHPPEGTVPRDRITFAPQVTDGVDDEGAYVDRVPYRLDRRALQRGQNRYDIFCAPCHGVAGDGVAQVAVAMSLRKPPTLVDAPIAAYPAGRLYQAIDVGYGLMRSYAADLTVEDRWAVVAYVQALQRARSTALDALPPAVRARALSELP